MIFWAVMYKKLCPDSEAHSEASQTSGVELLAKIWSG